MGVNQSVRLENQGKAVISFQLVLDNLQKSIHHVPEYPLSRFLSDVGGSFGLFLGISIASIVGYIEKMILWTRRFIIDKWVTPPSLRTSTGAMTNDDARGCDAVVDVIDENIIANQCNEPKMTLTVTSQENTPTSGYMSVKN